MPTVTYAQAYQVANRLNLSAVDGKPYNEQNIDTLNIPSKITIEELIEEAEVDIEKACGRAWRTITVSEWEYHDFTRRDYLKYNKYRRGRREVYKSLNFDDIQSITAFEILTNSGTWKDLVATGTLGVSPYDPSGDYFVQGRDLYFLNETPMYGQDNVRVKYTYGQTVVPKDIRKACILLVASRLIDYLPDMFIKNEGESGGISYGTLQSMWTKEVERIQARYNSESMKAIYI